MAEIVWKDISTYSKGETDRTPTTWETRIAGVRVVITRKWYGTSYGGWSKDWHVEADRLVSFQSEDDIEKVKFVALLKLKQAAMKIVDELDR